MLSSHAEIQCLKPLVKHLAQNDVLFDPEFFLSSVSKEWKPRVVAVYNRTELAGVVYAKEKTIFGCRLGVVYADLSLGSILLGDPVHQPKVFRVALETLLAFPGIRGLRLRILRGSPELAGVRNLIASKRFDVHFLRVKDHACLSLPDTYEQLLLGFGSTTRHNFRYYRRRFEGAGHTYLERLSLDELISAALYLEPRCRIASKSHSIRRVLNMVATADQPMAVGLKHRNGEWLSVIAGVYRPRAGVLLLQLNNDRKFLRDSLSVVLRGYLIETLIRQGMREFVIWAGTGPPLSRYVRRIHTLGIHLDLPAYHWRVARRFVTNLGPWLPKRLREDASWIAPFQ
jgi:hypothetical protein